MNQLRITIGALVGGLAVAAIGVLGLWLKTVPRVPAPLDTSSAPTALHSPKSNVPAVTPAPPEPVKFTRQTYSPVPSDPAPSLPQVPPLDLPLTPRGPAKDPNARASEIIMFPMESADRVAAARSRSGDTVKALFAQAGVKYPAQQIFLRGLKREGELELWAADRPGPWKLVATYAAAALSGRPGPKRQEGDRQVPEGFYEVDRFNPQSNFHLSLGLNYPNAADRILGHPERPGYDIFVHGNALSIGCLAMGDDRIEEIYLAATDARERPIRVHLFPARMTARDWPTWREEQVRERPELGAFWDELRVGWDLFETEREIPRVTVLPDGRYRCVSGRK